MTDEPLPPAVELLDDTYPNSNGQIHHTKTIPEKNEQTVPAEDYLPDSIAFNLEHELYTHQATALKYIDDGHNVCVATSTSSGKTLVYAVELARQYLQDETARGLFVYPTKALSRDQKAAIEELYDQLGLDISVGVYDGDTPQSDRKGIRENANVIITNFAGLNYYLPTYELWEQFYRNLDVVAVDESHTYTGIQGMHVAWIIRRLQRVLERYESAPTFLCTSATIGNPGEHSATLIGQPVAVIDNDGSPRGEREIIFWNPSDSTSDRKRQKPARVAAKDIIAHLTVNDVQTLAFARTRKATELTAHRTEERTNSDDGPWNHDIDVEPYHAGHEKDIRRETEQRLQDGSVDAIVSTSALELGIDIGGVGAGVLIGYPGTRQSFWQRLGRAGRGGTRSLGVFIGDYRSVDQYLMDNPDHLFGENVEDAVIDLHNNDVFYLHLLAAANEMTITEKDIGLLGGESRLRRALEMAESEGAIRGSLGTGAKFAGSGAPHEDIDIYATRDEQFEVKLVNSSRSIGKDPVQKERAYRDYFEGSINLHCGDQYRVVSLTDCPHTKQIQMKPTNVDYYTQSRSQTNIHNMQAIEQRPLNNNPEFTLYRGTGTVTVDYAFYDKIDIDSNKPIERQIPTGLDPIKMQTDMCWVEIPEPIQDYLANRYIDYEPSDPNSSGESPFAGYMGGVHATEHGVIGTAPLELMMEKSELGGLSVIGHPQIDPSGFILYDGVQGGLGFSHNIYEQFESVLEKTRERFASCDCSHERGCPACTMDDQCGDGNSPLHSGASIELIDYMLGNRSLPTQSKSDSRAPVTDYRLS